MEDERIIALFLARNDAAIEQIKCKYEAYCRTIAYHILGSDEDVDEVLNDLWLQTWESIPPQQPARLQAYLARIVRNLALDRCRRQSAQKRGSSFQLAYEELSDCISGGPSPEDALQADALRQSIRRFLAVCKERDRDIFLRRYFFFESTAEIAARFGLKPGNVLLILSRCRQKLKQHLHKEGFL